MRAGAGRARHGARLARLGCWHQGQREEFLRGEKPGWHARDEDAVVLTFDAASGRYRLLEALPDPALLAEHPAMARYRPRCNLRPASPSARTRALLPPALRLAGRLR